MLPLDVVHAFANAINRRSADELAQLMTEDHVFTDSLGTAVGGRDNMRAAWASYFQLIPGYSIAIEETCGNGCVVMLLGSARGTYAGEAWSTPAAWRAQVRGDLVAEWRVYADNEPLRQLMRQAR